MFLLVFVRHVGAHPDELQHGVSIQSSINLGKTFPRISRIRIIPSTQILARVFVYLPPFTSQILDFICRMLLLFILIYFEWRDTENQQLMPGAHMGSFWCVALTHTFFGLNCGLWAPDYRAEKIAQKCLEILLLMWSIYEIILLNMK